MEPKKYRKKPAVIEAMHFAKGHAPGIGYEIASWCGGRFNTDVKPSDHSDVRYTISIPTLEGVMTAAEGDYVIKGVQGEFYPCKPAIFRETYEAVDGVTAALAEVEASLKAEAWGEGYDAAAKQHPDTSFLGARNPYKALRGGSE